MTTNLEKLKAAAAALEEGRDSYLLSDLVKESELQLDIVQSLLKQHWIDQDELEIINIELTTEEHAALYR